MLKFNLQIGTLDVMQDRKQLQLHYHYVDALMFDLALQRNREFSSIWELLLKIGTFDIGGRVTFLPRIISILGVSVIKVEVYFEDYYLFNLYEFETQIIANLES